jgi:hypothetical protein
MSDEILTLDDETRAAIYHTALAIRKTNDRTALFLSNYLQRNLGPVTYDYATPPPSPVEVLGATVNAIRVGDDDPRGPTFPASENLAAMWGFAFIRELFLDIRLLICGKKKNPGPLTPKTQGLLTGLAAAISRHLGVSDPAAIGLAALVLVTIAGASKKAFCKATNPRDISVLIGS